MLNTSVSFIKEAQVHGEVSFGELYRRLMAAECHIGMRKGLIPIYLAVVLHEFKQSVLITDRFGQVPTSTDVLLQINADPDAFSVKYLDWNPEKEAFIGKEFSKSWEEFEHKHFNEEGEYIEEYE